MKKSWKIVLGILGGILFLVILMSIFTGGKSEVEVTTDKVAKRSIVETVSASGKLQPQTEVKIQSEVSGQIVELPVKEGDLVEKGQLLVRINPDLYIAAVNRAEAALNTAKSNLASARARLAQAEAQFKAQELNFERQRRLYDEKAISKAEFDNAVSQYETAKAEVIAAKETINGAEFSIESAQASKNEATDNLKRTTIMAPMSGTVTALTKEIGETVLGNNMMSGDIIMKISALNTMEVNVEVNESDIVRVNVGDSAIVEVDAFQDVKFKGIVTEIGNTALNALTGAALSTNEVTNFSVKILVLEESYSDLLKGQAAGYSPFKPGMSATVDIETETVMDVLTVPIKAVTSRDDTASFKSDEETKLKEPLIAVFVLNESNEAIIREVKTGAQDDEYIHIKDGLKEGEEVITGPYEEVAKRLKNKDKVKKEEQK
ncbi:MAG: efflux RND transporter periplasmic adaptor subunit [Flavobacteriales bacterium]|jgi:HlyD family secretion protein